ncbi:MAG: transporter permease [Chloroflexi bacterium]|nr:transporter permease [Chloroflexota bacterium]
MVDLTETTDTLEQPAKARALYSVGHAAWWLIRHPALLITGVIALLWVYIVFFPGTIARSSPTDLNMAQAFQAPASTHLFGTDEAGRDLFSRIIYGARYSLGMAFAIVIPAAVFGVVVGVLAGYVGGRTDYLLMRLVDIFFAFPYFVLAMATASALGRGIVSLVIALLIVWWPGYARLVRGMVLVLREQQYVESARAMGIGTPGIIWRHILPFVAYELNVRATQDIGFALIGVTSLSYLGLGAQPPTPEWGLIISGSQSYLMGSWWYLVIPGLVIALATLSFSLFGDALSDALASRRSR